MSLHMVSGIAERIVTCLRDYHATELTAVDTLEGGGITTPPIASAYFYAWDRKNLEQTPACTIAVLGSRKIAVDYPSSGNILDAWHRVDVKFHAGIKQASDRAAATVQILLQRYVQAAFRVLCMEKVHLETADDATQYVDLVVWDDDAPITYGPDEAQADGSLMRTAILPLAIRRIETNT